MVILAVASIRLKDNDMARKAFFCFSHDRDYWRALNVRNSWISQEHIAAGFFESCEWESVENEPDSVIEKWIDAQLNDTTVTVVLIGADTAGKKWIEYEIMSSLARGNGMLGIYVQGIKDIKGNTTARGANPFDRLTLGYPVYEWIKDDGYYNLDNWIEEAARAAGK